MRIPTLMATKRLLQNILMALFLLALLVIGFRLWPHPPLS
ncbi:transglycosylase, partial [Yersinia pestis]